MVKKKNDIVIPKEVKEPVGVAGSELIGGYVQEEHISGLQGTEGAAKMGEMSRSDDTIGGLSWAVKGPVLGGTYQFESAEPGEKEYDADAEFLNDIIFEAGYMKKDWETYLNEFMSIVDYGFYLGLPHIKAMMSDKYGPLWYLYDIAYRHQETIEKWEVENDELVAVEQQAGGVDTPFWGEVPVDDHTIIASLMRTGNNFEGKSLWRNAYGNYYIKKLLKKLKMVGFERSVLGVPYAITKEQLREGSNAWVTIKRMMKNLTSHKKAYGMFAESQVTDIKNFEISFNASDLEKAIEQENLGMAISLVADFIFLGHGGGGAYNLGLDKSDFFFNAVMNIINQMAKPLNGLGKSLIIWNRGKKDKYPKLRISGIKDKAGKEQAAIINMLVKAKIIQPDDTLEDFFRALYKYPKKEEPEEISDNTPPDKGSNKPSPDPEPEEKDNPEPEEKDKPENKDINKDKKAEFQDDDKEKKRKPFWRAFTEYEKKVEFHEIDRKFKNLKEEFNYTLENDLNKIIEKYIVDLRKRLLTDGGNIYKVIENTPLGNTSALQDGLESNIRKAVIAGKIQMTAELDNKKMSELSWRKLSDKEKLGPGIYGYIKHQAKKISENKQADIKKRISGAMTLSVGNLPQGKKLTNTEKNAIVAKGRGAGMDYVKNTKNLDGSYAVGQAINQGRKDTAHQRKEEVSGFQYSAILDDKTTDICMELDGQKRKEDDYASANNDPPNHFGCRSILVSITFKEKAPTWTGFHIGSEASKKQNQFKEALANGRSAE